MADVETVTGWIVAALGAGGGGKFVFDLVSARVKSRRGKTEESVLFVNSASKFARQLTEDTERLRAQFDKYRDQQAAYNARLDERLRLHTMWDAEVRRKLLELGESVTVPPPLYVAMPNEEGRS